MRLQTIPQLNQGLGRSIPYRRLVAAVGLLAAACGSGPSALEGDRRAQISFDDLACRVALAAHQGPAPSDERIRMAQQEVRTAQDPWSRMERLGWLYVEKARKDYDPGYYKLAEQSADCVDLLKPNEPAALLLRGHVWHNLHRFKEAEEVARRLVQLRGFSYDFGLLGDALMEQGRLLEAAAAYQKMVDMKPDLRAYSRAAHVRWLKGDLEGAIHILELAVGAGSPRDAEATAWVWTRLALYRLQAGSFEQALQAADRAFEYRGDYAPALLARGRILLSQGRETEAIDDLISAARLNPLPEYQWVLAEALAATGRADEALRAAQELKQRGPSEDPRTFSLYLATRGEDIDQAFKLARQELEVRGDVFTLDALAWAATAAGRTEEAQTWIRQALAEGTQDARLFLHAGLIAAQAGNADQAAHWLSRARKLKQMLLPSERFRLEEALATG